MQTATAMVAAVGHIDGFRRGRQFASWLGLTPRESSSGSHRTLGHISKRGDVHLRCLVIHGARAVLRCALLASARRPDRVTRLQQWALATAQRRGRRKATVAIANKLARVIWAVWRRDETFRPTQRSRRIRLPWPSQEEVLSETHTHGMSGRTAVEPSR
jgi:transposase